MNRTLDHAGRVELTSGAGYYWAIRAMSVVVVLGAWEVLGAQVNPIFLSTPSRIGLALFTMARTGLIFEALRCCPRPS